MYKPIKYLTERQKRRLRQQVLRGIENNLVPRSIQTNDPNYLSTRLESSQSKPDVLNNRNLLCENEHSEEMSNICNADTLLPSDIAETSNLIGFTNENDKSNTSSQCSCSECNHLDSTDIVGDLKCWVVNCNISLSHATKLLQILNKHKIDVPRDARTLLGTPRSVAIMTVEPGEYSHIGIEKGILGDLSTVPKELNMPSNIKININVDGLPLSKSSGSQFWPVLGWIVRNTFLNVTTKPFVIGMYHGYSKPKSSNDFLHSFVKEFRELKKNGIIWEGKKIDIEINALICDAPAKAFVKCIKSHTGYHGCGKCIQEGDFLNNRMSFPELGNPLRTDESFRSKIDEDHHTGVSILENLDVGLVSQVPLDYMHLVCLGVMKRLLQFWCKGKQNIRLQHAIFEKLCQVMLCYKDYITKDFCRKPRDFKDVDRFKATEFRQILLYTGVVGFKDLLPENMYNHFLHLSCAIRILTSPSLCVNLNETAQNLLENFIIMYSNIYGREYVTYNVHNLSHLCNDVLRFGCLDNFSAFPAEAYMYHLKKKICLQSGKPLPQIVKRLNEESRENSFKLGINYSNKIKYVEVSLNNIILTNKHPDNCCLLKSGNYIAVSDITQDNNDIFLKGTTITLKDSFFKDPIDSRTLGIHLCTFNDGLIAINNIKDVLCKAMILPYKNDWVVLPLVHTGETF